MGNVFSFDGSNMNINVFNGCLKSHESDDKYDLFSAKPVFCVAEPDVLSDEIRYVEEVNGTTHIYIDNEEKNTILYLYFCVKSKRNCKVIFDTLLARYTKIWNNGELVTVVGVNMENEDNSVISHQFATDLNKGANYFIIEIYHPSKKNMFLMQALSFDYHSGKGIDCLSTINGKADHTDLNIISKTMIWDENNAFTFKIAVNDHIKHDYIFLRVLDYDENIIYTRRCPLNEIITISKSEFRFTEGNILDINCFRFAWYDSKGRSRKHYIHVITRDIDKIIDFLQSEYNKRAEWKHDSSIQWQFQLIKKFLYEDKSIISAFWECHSLYFNKIKGKQIKPDKRLTVKREVFDNIFYKSDIDFSDERIMVRLPKRYNPEKKYPLILHVAIGQYGWEGYTASLYPCFDRVIYADVSIKGQTLGSYMGEACFFENLHEITEKYKIDEDRIYLFGASNGAYACWRFMIKHPQIFAGAFPLAGYPQISQVENTFGIKIINMVSDKDYVFDKKQKEIRNRLSEYGNYRQVDVKGMLHCQLLKFAVNPKAYGYLSRYKRNPYPDEIHFVSSQYRYRTSYWLTLGMISKDCKEMRADIMLKNNSTILAEISGTDSFCIELPPKINAEKISVKINGSSLDVNPAGRRTIYFSKETGIFHESNDFNLPSFSRKGTGIADVYYEPLTIVYDKAMTCYEKISEKLSKPVSNVNDGYINVKYPVVDRKEWDKASDRNAIILEMIDHKHNSFLTGEQYIQCKPLGFEYKSRFYQGKYVVMQIVPHPYANNRAVLLISSNDERMLRTHIYLRKMVLSSDCFSINPYLNNEALILHDGKYKCIYSWDDEIENMR